MKTFTTLMAAAIVLASASVSAYEMNTNEYISNQNISLDNPASNYEVSTLQLQLENDNPMIVEERLNSNTQVEYASLVNGDLKYDMHEMDM